MGEDDTLPGVVALELASLRARWPRPDVPHRWCEHAHTAQDQVVPRLAGATVALINKVRIGADELARLPALRMVSISATGTDNVDLDACRARGVAVCNVRGYATDAVPEHALMLMLALARQLPGYRQDVASGRWSRAATFCLIDRPVRDLAGMTLAIIGHGELGAGLARRAEALGMQVLLAERKAVASVRSGRIAFAEALAAADVVSLHCPLTAETRGLIGAPELAAMKPGALLINTARGGLVDEAALAHALRDGHLGGAATDVLTQEPPRANNPLLAPGLPNLIVTPHMAWASDRAMQCLADRAIAHIEAYLNGHPVSRVV